jgi:hypothetical protein
VVGHQLAGRRRRTLDSHAERLKHAMGNALADLMRHRPLLAFRPLGRSHDDGRLFVPGAIRFGQPHVACPPGETRVVRHDHSKPVRNHERIDGRAAHAHFPQHVLGACVQGRSELVGGNLRYHRKTGRTLTGLPRIACTIQIYSNSLGGQRSRQVKMYGVWSANPQRLGGRRPARNQ